MEIRDWLAHKIAAVLVGSNQQLDLKRLAQSKSCQQQAIAPAVQAVSSPQLAAVYAAHAKHS